MKFSLVRVPSRPFWPAWAIIVGLAWLALVCADVYISNRFDHEIQLCLFKKVTSVPCPTCGITRGIIHGLQGHFITAWQCNPLLFSLGVLFLIITIIRGIFGRAVRISLSLNEHRFAWIIAILLVLINWVYIIYCVG